MTRLRGETVRPLPPGLSDDELERALESFAAVVGREAVLTSEDELLEFRDPFAFATWDDYTASAVVLPETVEEIQEIVRIANRFKVPLWTNSTGTQQRLRRAGAATSRLGDPQPAAPEPRARGQRGVRVCGRRAGRPLVRPLRGCTGWRAQADGLGAGSRLGQRDRQHARPRRQLHAVRRPSGEPVRDGGRAPERRGDAHRDGSDAGQPRVACLQARTRALPRRHVHAVELRDRHEDGCLADAPARVLHAALAQALERRRSRAGDRHAARADARPHDRERAAAREHDRPGLGDLEPREVVPGRGPDPRSDDRRDGPRPRHRPLDHALRPLRRRGGRRPQVSRRSRRRSSRSPARRSRARSARRSRSRTSSIRPSASRVACRTSTTTR